MAVDVMLYEREDLDGVMVVRFTRQPDFDEIIELMKEVTAQGVPNRRLWQVREFFDFRPSEVRRIANMGRVLWPDPSRVAYVASGEVYFGLLRMLEAYRDQEGYVTCAFRSEEEAMAWLREG